MTSAVAGLAPALQSTRVDLTAGLRDGAAGSGRRRTRLRRAFLAMQVWPDQSPLGKRIRFDGNDGPWLEVVGVSRPIRYNSLGETPPVFLYVPFAQQSDHGLNLHVVLTPGASVPAVSRRIVETLRALDPAVPPPTVRRLTDAQRVVLLPAQLGAALTGVFGGLALLLAAIGIFGVAAFDVWQRTRELGIRSALGAPAAAILRVVLSDTVRTVVIGGGVGIGLALALGRVLSSQLHSVSAVDPFTFFVTPVLLALVAAAATFVPARRTVSVDPAVALREG